MIQLLVVIQLIVQDVLQAAITVLLQKTFAIATDDKIQLKTGVRIMAASDLMLQKMCVLS